MDTSEKLEQLKVDRWAEYEVPMTKLKEQLPKLSDEELQEKIQETESRERYLENSFNAYSFKLGEQPSEEMQNAMFQYGLAKDMLELLNNENARRTVPQGIEPLNIE